ARRALAWRASTARAAAPPAHLEARRAIPGEEPIETGCIGVGRADRFRGLLGGLLRRLWLRRLFVGWGIVGRSVVGLGGRLRSRFRWGLDGGGFGRRLGGSDLFERRCWLD